MELTLQPARGCWEAAGQHRAGVSTLLFGWGGRCGDPASAQRQSSRRDSSGRAAPQPARRQPPLAGPPASCGRHASHSPHRPPALAPQSPPNPAAPPPLPLSALPFSTRAFRQRPPSPATPPPRLPLPCRAYSATTRTQTSPRRPMVARAKPPSPPSSALSLVRRPHPCSRARAAIPLGCLSADPASLSWRACRRHLSAGVPRLPPEARLPSSPGACRLRRHDLHPLHVQRRCARY